MAVIQRHSHDASTIRPIAYNIKWPRPQKVAGSWPCALFCPSAVSISLDGGWLVHCCHHFQWPYVLTLTSHRSFHPTRILLHSLLVQVQASGCGLREKKGTNMQANTLLTELHPPSLGSRLSKCSFHPDTRPGLLDWLPLPRLPADLRIDSRAPSLVFVNSFLADKNSAHIRLIELIYPCCGVAAF